MRRESEVEKMKMCYTDEENILILISLLKAHGIRKIIASPGTTNISFVGSVQSDPFFEVYSAVDESKCCECHPYKWHYHND